LTEVFILLIVFAICRTKSEIHDSASGSGAVGGRSTLKRVVAEKNHQASFYAAIRSRIVVQSIPEMNPFSVWGHFVQ
jgi:hypothetical protein